MNTLANEFKSADKRGSGYLSRDELLAVFKKHRGSNFDEKEINELIKMADSDNSGEINYSEWIIAALDRIKAYANEKLESAFRNFDKDGSISVEEIKGMFDMVKGIDENLVKRAIKEVDSHRRGELTI